MTLRARTNGCLEREKASSVLTSTQANIIIILLVTGLVRDMGSYYCDRKMIEQEVHCMYQLICKALQSWRLRSSHCSSLQRAEHEYPLASVLDLVKLIQVQPFYYQKLLVWGTEQKTRGEKTPNIKIFVSLHRCSIPCQHSD